MLECGEDELVDLVLAIAQGQKSKEEIATFLENNSRRVPQ